MIYTDCEDSTILRQLIDACRKSRSGAILTDSRAVERVAGQNLDTFRLYYIPASLETVRIELRTL